MPCEVLTLDTSVCVNANGGALYGYMVSAEYITAVTATANSITAMTMTTTGKWKKIVPNKNQTCRYDQNGERPNEFSVKKSYACEGFGYFAGNSAAIALVGDAVAACCNMVVIWVLGTGARIVQGLEIDAAATGGFTTSKEADCRCTANLLSDTAANEARLELLFQSKNAALSPYTTLTDSAIEAL